MKQFNSIEEFANNFNKGTFGMYAMYLTEPKMNKYPNGTLPSERQTATPNPYIGRVQTLTIMQNACSGVNYYTIVQSECKREGIEFSDEKFKERFPKEKTYCESVEGLKNVVMEHLRGQRYLRLYTGRKPTKSVYFTYLDGELVTDPKVMKDIFNFIPPKKESKKQEELGIENIVGVRQPKLENVCLLMQGEKIYINPHHEEIVKKYIKDIAKLFLK